ncbi:MAG: SO2930 family diheme c-type cytochrome [Marinoscillum sp.]
MRFLVLGWVLFTLLFGCDQVKKKPVLEEVSLVGSAKLDVPDSLSKWRLFKDPLHNLEPESGVVPYDINSPLFSDYALKARFIKILAGATATYHPTEVFDFPLGTILIKNFYYQSDLSVSHSKRRVIETRLLISEKQGWNALTYVWNDEQTEATLEIAGKTVPVSWKDENGVLQNVNYSVPNLVQCKSCHERSSTMSLIGPSARQLNKQYGYSDNLMNQLEHWEELGILAALPPVDSIPKMAQWDNPGSGTLDSRARGWLEINCAHCHRAEGPAKNTGLYLLASEKDKYRLGINKPPVAAGRGSGGLKYGIVPGEPNESILVHRIESLDPGVMMPEVGRKLVHQEGVALIREWIAQMQPVSGN